jgi:hypothetical protein
LGWFVCCGQKKQELPCCHLYGLKRKSLDHVVLKVWTVRKGPGRGWNQRPVRDGQSLLSQS